MEKSNFIMDLENAMTTIGGSIDHPTNTGIIFAVLVMKGIVTAEESIEIEQYFKNKPSK